MQIQAFNRRQLSKLSFSELKDLKKVLKINRASIMADQSNKQEIIVQILNFFKHAYRKGNLFFVIEDEAPKKLSKKKVGRPKKSA